MATMNDEETALIVPAQRSEPVLSESDRLAMNIVAILDKLAESIPELRPPNPETARRARGARTVSREFVLSAMAMVEATPALRNLGVFDTQKPRRVLQSRDGLRLISERLTRFVATVNHTLEAEWADAARGATEAYRMANALASSGLHDDLLPHLKILRRHLGRAKGGRRKKQGDPGKE
jgi:hypothetical protein